MEITRRQRAERILASLEAETSEPLNCERTELYASLEAESLQLSQLPIKIISILGGLLSACLFTGFLLALGMWESGAAMCLLGVVFIGGSLLVISREATAYFSALAISFLFIGLILFGVGIGISTESISGVCLAMMLACGVLVVATTNGLILFVVTLVFLGSCLGLLLQGEYPLVLHLYVAAHAGLLLCWCLAETSLISRGKHINVAYRPIRMGIVLGFGALMVFLASMGSLGDLLKFPYPWVSGGVLILALMVFAWKALARSRQPEGDEGRLHKGFLLLPILLLPLVSAPGVVGGFLLILLGYHLRHLPSLLVGVAAFGYTLFLFYYDLHLTLLEKSGMLLLSGVWFLIGYLVLKRYAKQTTIL